MGEQVDPQDLCGEKGQRQAHERSDQHDEVFRGPAGQGVQQVATDVGVDAAAFFHGRYDGGKVVIGEDEVRCLAGYFCSAPAHGHADVGPAQGGAVVDAFDETRLPHEQRAKRWLGEALARPTAGHPDVPVRRVVVESRARPALQQAAAHADPLVVGARRRSNALAPQLGPVNHAMLHYAQCSIAVVPGEGSAD
ncbi:universal stress protein [Streptomyces tubercidicus]|nr:universal stress protein [Streptomyces tubercidicus]